MGEQEIMRYDCYGLKCRVFSYACDCIEKQIMTSNVVKDLNVELMGGCIYREATITLVHLVNPLLPMQFRKLVQVTTRISELIDSINIQKLCIDNFDIIPEGVICPIPELNSLVQEINKELDRVGIEHFTTNPFYPILTTKSGHQVELYKLLSTYKGLWIPLRPIEKVIYKYV